MKSSLGTTLMMLAFMSIPFVTWGVATNNRILQIQAEIITQSKTNLLLELVVKNIGSKDVSIPNGYLPWDRYAMTLVLVNTDPASTPLKQQLEISDPLLGEPHKLKKGEIMKGCIDLTDRFPQLLKVLERDEVIVFWSYQLDDETETKFERIGGWIHIPKNKTGAIRSNDTK